MIITENFETTRKELLDISLRGNTLINYRTSSKSIDVIDEKSKEVYSLLVEQQKNFSFLPLPENLIDDIELNDDILPQVEYLESRYGANRFTDTKLQTNLSPDKLDKQLLKISGEAKTLTQETGVDTLFLVLGFLHWKERDDVSTMRKAPLVLIPVSIERLSAKKRFTISYTGSDLGTNLSLAAKLKNDFDLILPSVDDNLDIEDYFHNVESLTESFDSWKIEKDEISLGFFSFGRFLMYADLDPEKWAEHANLEDNPIIQALMRSEGFAGTDYEMTSTGSPLLQSFDPTSQFFVLDADSSQTEAILAVNKGVNLVIQGPPGTGKSQTITNIIAEAVAQDKKVLFVSEKMAALEVVKKRLDDCEIGIAALELHSHKSNKKTVLEEIKTTVELGAPKISDHARDLERYEEIRRKLNSYSKLANQNVRNTNLSFVTILGKHLRYKNIAELNNLPELRFKPFKDLSHQQFSSLVRIVNEIELYLEHHGVPSSNAFFKSRAKQYNPADKKTHISAIEEALLHLSIMMEQVENTALAIGADIPQTLHEVEKFVLFLTVYTDSPNLSRINHDLVEWTSHSEELNLLISCGQTMEALKNENICGLREESWEKDIHAIEETYRVHTNRRWRHFSSDFRNAKNEVDSLREQPSSSRMKQDDIYRILNQINTYQENLNKFNSLKIIGETLFQGEWSGTSSNWDMLHEYVNWTQLLAENSSKNLFSASEVRIIQEKGMNKVDLSTIQKSLQEQIETCKEGIEDVFSKLKFSTVMVRNLPEWHFEKLSKLSERLTLLKQNFDEIYTIIQFNILMEKAEENNLSEIITISSTWQQEPSYLSVILKNCWYKGLVLDAYNKEPELQMFDRVSHEKLIEEFKSLDISLFSYAKERLLARLHDNLPMQNEFGEMNILHHEFHKTRRHLPIRQLLLKAGKAIQNIKPIFMMSPMSIAKYLDPDAVTFDLVVFDEASQMKVADSLGAIARSKQVVVVGDSKQMPPTNFFSRSIELDDEEAEASQTADIESILGLFLSKGSPQKFLRWHYRSQHDSLIAVSNKEFYENKLMVFPSPGINPKARGLKFHYVENSAYDRSASRTNKGEAAAVATAVMNHAKRSPEISLGVVAFSTAQREQIILEIEKARRLDDSCEAFFNKSGIEEFFVKNLENVQGDERDVIYISIGYGRTHDGRLSHNFGPINTNGGERRLNVLITRSRLAMDVFCNFKADELKISGSTSKGLQVLKNFLYYAETGEYETYIETGNEPDSPFEHEVLLAIKDMGYEVEPQVGSAEFFIDLAVRDPKNPGRYILAVECDGASYHSSKTARDRDRIRQTILEGLGWRFHRIWSTEWFRTQGKEQQRLKQAIQEAQTFFENPEIEDSYEETPAVISAGTTERSNPVPAKPLEGNTYQIFKDALGLPRHLEIHEQKPRDLAAAIQKIVAVEGPIHVELIAKRITNAFGYSRVGNRINESILTALNTGTSMDFFSHRGDFVYQNPEKKGILRNRANLSPVEKKFEYVPEEEIQEAISHILLHAFSISRKELISATLSILGFQRATLKISDRVDKVIDSQQKEQTIIEQSGNLSAVANR